jgi:membrane protease YdiL (CAAX protease family)
MKTWLPPPTREFSGGEFCLVIALAFGLSIAGSISAALSYNNQPVEFTDTALAATIIYELIVGTVVGVVLRSREWQWSDFEIHASRGSTILGALVAVGVLVLWIVLGSALGKVPNDVSVTLPWVAAISIVNPLFEELLVLGYVVQALRKRFGLNVAMNVSIAIRVLYHLYQGPTAVIPIAAMGVVVTLVYVRLGRLWPAIVAHALLDFIALAGWLD